MAAPPHSMAMALTVVLALLVSTSLALDMSIIDYNLEHCQGQGGVPFRSEAQIRRIYELWLVRHRKVHNALGEKEKRFQIFKDNLQFIDKHNSVNRTYKVGLNKFADLTNEEYRAGFLGARMDRKNKVKGTRSERYLYKDGDDLPVNIDWRENGAVVPVKDQGQCGTFFSFSTSFV